MSDILTKTWKDYRLASKKRYKITENSDGTFNIEDATDYSIEGNLDEVNAEFWNEVSKSLNASAGLSYSTKITTKEISGDTKTLEYTCQHGFNTKAVMAQVWERVDDTTATVIKTDINIIDANNIKIIFKEAPSANSTYRIVIMGDVD